MTNDDKKVPHKKHDLGYKYLFSFVELFQQFIEGFVDEEWKNHLDFSRAEKIDKEYVLDDFREIESDILYKIPMLDSGEIVYLYILVEMQSTVDQGIALRVLFYLVSVWQDIYRNIPNNERKKKDFKLPPVFPIVLYNGNHKWTAAATVAELVQKGDVFYEFIPNLRYHLVDISQEGIDKLKKQANALAGVFLLEKESSLSDIQKQLHHALSWINNEQNSELWKGVIRWLLYYLERQGHRESKDIFTDIDLKQNTRKEITTMIQTLPERLIELGKKEGHVKGLQEGHVKGLQEGIISMLEVLGPEFVEKYTAEVMQTSTEKEIMAIKEKIKSKVAQKKQ